MILKLMKPNGNDTVSDFRLISDVYDVSVFNQTLQKVKSKHFEELRRQQAVEIILENTALDSGTFRQTIITYKCGGNIKQIISEFPVYVMSDSGETIEKI